MLGGWPLWLFRSLENTYMVSVPRNVCQVLNKILTNNFCQDGWLLIFFVIILELQHPCIMAFSSCCVDPHNQRLWGQWDNHFYSLLFSLSPWVESLVVWQRWSGGCVGFYSILSCSILFFSFVLHWPFGSLHQYLCWTILVHKIGSPWHEVRGTAHRIEAVWVSE